jgi:hypothetical protein
MSVMRRFGIRCGHQSGQGGLGAAVVEHRAGQFDALAQGLDLVGHQEGGGGVEHDDVAIGALLAVQQGGQGGGVEGGVAAGDVGQGRARQAHGFRGDREQAQRPVAPFGDLGLAGGGQLVHAGPVHRPGALGAQRPQGLGHRLDEAMGRDADHLALGAGRIGQRAQQVEDGAEAQLLADRRDVLHRPVVRLGEQEADAGRRPALGAAGPGWRRY